MDLQEFISSKNIALYMKQLPVENTIDQRLFPNVKQLSTKIEFAKGAKQKPVAIRMSRLDVATRLRTLQAKIDIYSREMPFFKEGVGMDETTRRQLIEYLNVNNIEIVRTLINQVFDGYKSLIDGCNIVARAMRCQVIQNGYLNFITQDGDVVIDYLVPDNHRTTLVGDEMWTNENADIVGDVKAFQKAIMEDQYAKPTTMLMTETTFQKTFMKNKAINDHLRSNINAKTLILSQNDYLEFTKRVIGIDIVFLEKDLLVSTYVPYEGAEPVKYYEDGKITFMSGSTLGKTVYGFTPEEYDKTHGTGKLDTTMLGNIAITTSVKDDPISIDVKVSQMVVPSFERADEVYFATVYSE